MAKKTKLAHPPAGEPVSVTVSCPVHESFRVAQMTGMFDVPPAQRASETFDVTLPADSEPWQIGVVVGPSGSGKSTVSNHRWSDRVYTGADWPADRAVVDCFPEQLDVKAISAMLTSVGFSSPPSWVKPYAVLSNGEKFRCDLARSLLAAGDGEPESVSSGSLRSPAQIVVFDEFTSVVDRTVAKIGSAAVAKAVRRRQGFRFVAVTCHYDVVEWLEPDWVLDMQSRVLERRLLRRPSIELELHQTPRDVWRLFKKTHYLSADIGNAGRLFVATWHGTPVACCYMINNFRKRRPGFKGQKRISRVVVLPDFQGVGIGRAITAGVAELYAAEGHHVTIISAHPSMIAIVRSDPRWRVVRLSRTGNERVCINRAHSQEAYGSTPGEFRSSFGRCLVSAEWRGAGPAQC